MTFASSFDTSTSPYKGILFQGVLVCLIVCLINVLKLRMVM